MDLDLLLEAERRGILPADKVDLLAEARNRGLVGGGATKPTEQSTSMVDDLMALGKRGKELIVDAPARQMQRGVEQLGHAITGTRSESQKAEHAQAVSTSDNQLRTQAAYSRPADVLWGLGNVALSPINVLGGLQKFVFGDPAAATAKAAGGGETSQEVASFLAEVAGGLGVTKAMTSIPGMGSKLIAEVFGYGKPGEADSSKSFQRALKDIRADDVKLGVAEKARLTALERADAEATKWASELTGKPASAFKIAEPSGDTHLDRFMDVEARSGKPVRGAPEPGGIPDPPKFQKGTEADLPPYPRQMLPGSTVRPTGVEGDIAAAERSLYDSQHASAQVEQAAEWAPYSSSAGSRPIPGPGETVIPRGEGAEPLIRQGPGSPRPPGWQRVPRQDSPGGTMAPGSLSRPEIEAPGVASTRGPTNNPAPGQPMRDAAAAETPASRLARRQAGMPETQPSGATQAQLDRIAQLEAEIAQRKAALARNTPSVEAPKQEVPTAQPAPQPAPQPAVVAKPVETAAPTAPVAPETRVPGVEDVKPIPEPPIQQPQATAVSEPVLQAQEPRSPLDEIHGKLSGLKHPNSKSAEKLLDDLEMKHGYEVDDARGALEDYRDMQRSDYDDVASYKEDRADAWQSFLDEVGQASRPDEAEVAASRQAGEQMRAARAARSEAPTAITPEVLPPEKPQGKTTGFDFGEKAPIEAGVDFPAEPVGLRPAVKIDGKITVAPEGATSHAQMSDIQADLFSGKISPDADVQSGWVDSKGRFFDSQEAAQVADMSIAQKLKAALGSEVGTAGRFTPEQEAAERLAKAARADLYRTIEAAAKSTGRSLAEAASAMDVPGPAFRRLVFEHTTDQAVNAFGKAADSMAKLNERAQVIGPEAEVMGSTGNVSRETRPGIQNTWGNKKPQTYDHWISQKSKDIVTNNIAEVGKQLAEARRVATSMGDKVTSQQFDEASKKFNGLQKELNRLADRYMKERLTAGRIVESYKRTAAVFPEEVMDELRQIGHMVDEGRKLKEKIPIASNIAESVGRVIKDRSFQALSHAEQVQMATDIVDHARYNLFGPLTASFDLISNTVRAGVELPVGLTGDIAHSIRQRELSLPNTAGIIRAIGIRRPSNNWPGMPKFLDDALAPARQPGEKMFSRRTSPLLQEKLGQTFGGEPIPGNLGLGDQFNRPSQWLEKGLLKTGENGVFTRRSNQWSAAYDTIVGAPMYSKSDADKVYKNIFGNGLIWREAFTEADKQGLKGIDRHRFVDNFWANLPQNTLEDAITESNKAGWNRPLSHMAERWARNPAVKLFVDPFSRWTFQFGKWGAEMLGRNPTVYRKFKAGTLGPEEATRYFTRSLAGFGGVYALDRWFNQNPNGYVDYRSGEWVDSKNGDRQRLSNFEPVMTALMLGQVMKAGYAASTGDSDGSREHMVKAGLAMRFSSLPMLKFLYGDGGLLGGPIGTMGDALRNGTAIDTQRLHDEMTNTVNHLIPGQAVMSLMKHLTDPTLREGLGSNIPGLSYATDERIDMSTGGPISPKQRVFGAELPAVGGTPLPGARRIVQPVAGALSKYGMMEYRGPRLPIAGYRASEAPEGVTREWETAFGKARNQIFSQVLPSIREAEARARPGDLKPNSPYYENIRKTLMKYDTMAAKFATDQINKRYLSQGKMPRRKTVRELSTASEAE